MSVWCEHCRDHYDVEHYSPEGHHFAGAEYGPTGVDQSLREAAFNAAEELEKFGRITDHAAGHELLLAVRAWRAFLNA